MILFAAAHAISNSLPGSLAFFVLGLSAVGLFAAQQRSGLRPAAWSAAAVIVFGALDWVMLAALPRLGLSYGPTRTSLMWISALRLGVWVVLLAGAALAGSLRRTDDARGRLPTNAFLWGAFAAISILAFYGMYIEPFDLRTTTLRLQTPHLAPGQRVRIVQLSDIHVERITRREGEMLAQVKALQPDLIVLTGDYLNIDYTGDPQTRREARQVLEQLRAPYGVFAVTGTHGVDRPEAIAAVFDGLAIRLLNGETERLQIHGLPLDLIGIDMNSRDGGRAGDQAALMALASEKRPEAFSMLLYHSPDLAESAAAAGIDLYLAGHTHGGQIRLPGYGAIVTMSAYGKRFEAGLYALDRMRLYVSRGIGMEGLRLPRARLLAPPEIVVVELEHGPEISAAVVNTDARR